MKPIRDLVIGVSIYLLIYAAAPPLGMAYDLIFLMFIIGHGLLLYMVYGVLKWGEEPKGRWKEGDWYSDIDKKYSKNA